MTQNHRSSQYGDDLLIWSAILGEMDFCHFAWAESAAQGRDPIRTALMAASLSRKAASMLRHNKHKSDAEKFSKNGDEFEAWACNLLVHCRNDDDARLILLRENRYWENNSILVAAIQR